MLQREEQHNPTCNKLSGRRNLPFSKEICRAWGSVVVKVLRYQSSCAGIDSRWCHWGFFPCALSSIQPLKVSTRDFFWGKGGRCAWLTTYHPCSAETSRKFGALTYPEPFGLPRPVAGDLYFTLVRGLRKTTQKPQPILPQTKQRRSVSELCFTRGCVNQASVGLLYRVT